MRQTQTNEYKITTAGPMRRLASEKSAEIWIHAIEGETFSSSEIVAGKMTWAKMAHVCIQVKPLWKQETCTRYDNQNVLQAVHAWLQIYTDIKTYIRLSVIVPFPRPGKPRVLELLNPQLLLLPTIVNRGQNNPPTLLCHATHVC